MTHVGFVLYGDDHNALLERGTTLPMGFDDSDLLEYGRMFSSELHERNAIFSSEGELVRRLIEFIR